MPKLETYGVITPEEYQQAERAGRFLIAENVTCSYCDQPVTVETDTQYLYCRTHRQLALTMYWYPGYPAVPMDAPRYKEMHFFLAQLERNLPLFDRQTPEYLAREKGCPFCDRYLTPVDPRSEGERDFSLLNQPMSCPECGVAFLISVSTRTLWNQEVLSLRFTLQDKDRQKILAAETTQKPKGPGDTDSQNPDRHTTLPQQTTTQPKGPVATDSQNEAPETDPDTIPADPVGECDFSDLLPTPPNHENTPPEQTQTTPQTHVATPTRPEHKNAHTDIAGQIVEYLSDAPMNTAETREMRTAIGCVPEGFNKAVKKLIETGKISKLKRGVYQLIHHP